ncbi:hypothetical protein B4Q13_20310 [Lacticaseibacillus rhamnosus]
MPLSAAGHDAGSLVLAPASGSSDNFGAVRLGTAVQSVFSLTNVGDSASGSLGLGGNPLEQGGTSRATGRRPPAPGGGRPWQASAVRRAINDQLRTGTDKGNLTV